MEAATAFSTGRVAEKTIVVTIVVNYEGFRKYVQELDAMKRVSPVVPVQGQLITTLIDPSSIRTAGDNAVSTEYALASAEHFMHIDGITYETIDNAPRDIRVSIVMTKVATPFLDDDSQRYAATIDDAFQQSAIIDRLEKTRGDNSAIEAIASMLGVTLDKYRVMIQAMQNRGSAYPIANGRSVIRTETGNVYILGTVVEMLNDYIIISPLDTDIGIPVEPPYDMWQYSHASMKNIIVWCSSTEKGVSQSGNRIMNVYITKLTMAEARKKLPINQSMHEMFAVDTERLFIPVGNENG